MEVKGNKYIFLTIEGEHYTLLRMQKARKGWEVLNYETNFSPTKSTKGTLSELAKKAKDNKWLNEPCYLILPRHEITSRIITLPSQDPNEIMSMVELNAEEFVPYSLEEIQISQCVLEKLPDSHSRVFVAIVHRDLIQEKLKILRELGWEPQGIWVSTGGFIHSLPEIIKRAKPIHTIFIHLALGGIEVSIFENSILRFSRGVRTTWESIEVSTSTTIPSVSEPKQEEILDPFRASEEFTSSPRIEEEVIAESSGDIVQELLREIRTSINSYQREAETEITIDTIYISSDFSVEGQLKEELTKLLDIPCVSLSITDFPSLQSNENISPPVSMPLIGAGLAVYHDKPILLDLLPEELRITHQFKNLSRHLIRVGVLVSLLILTLVGWFAENVYLRMQLIRELEKQVAELEPNARGIAEKRQQLQILRREVAKSGSVLDYLSRISEAVPPKVNLNMFSYRRGEGINIWGRALLIDDIHTFAENLRKQAVSSSLKALQQARSVYEQQTREQNQIVYDYQITIPFVEEEELSGSGATQNP